MRFSYSLPLFASCLALALTGCPDQTPAGQGAESPEAAVVAWLAAVDRNDYEAAARLAPPGLTADGQAELAADLASRLEGARRDDEAPFSMSDPEGDRAMARVKLRTGDGSLPVELELEAHGGRWYVVPPRHGEVQAW